VSFFSYHQYTFLVSTILRPFVRASRTPSLVSRESTSSKRKTLFNNIFNIFIIWLCIINKFSKEKKKLKWRCAYF